MRSYNGIAGPLLDPWKVGKSTSLEPVKQTVLFVLLLFGILYNVHTYITYILVLTFKFGVSKNEHCEKVASESHRNDDWRYNFVGPKPRLYHRF